MSTMNKDDETESNSRPSSDLQGLLLDNIGSEDSTLLVGKILRFYYHYYTTCRMSSNTILIEFSDDEHNIWFYNLSILLVNIDEDKLKESTAEPPNDVASPCPVKGEEDHQMPCIVCPEDDDSQRCSENERLLENQTAQDVSYDQNVSSEDLMSADKDATLIVTQNDKTVFDIQASVDVPTSSQISEAGNDEVLVKSLVEPNEEDKPLVVGMNNEQDFQVVTDDKIVTDSYECIDQDLINSIPVESAISSTSSASAASSAQSRQPSEQSLYKIKMIKWKETSVPIVTQNENGPCPLIAIVNVLLSRAKVNPFGNKTEVKAEDLLSYLGECMLLNAPKVRGKKRIQRFSFSNFKKHFFPACITEYCIEHIGKRSTKL